MKRFIVTTIIVALMAFLVYQERTIGNLMTQIEYAQARIDNLEAIRAEKDASIAQLLRTALTNLVKGQKPEDRRVVTVTAYSADPAQTDETPNHTANNRRVRPGIVAVSRDLYAAGWEFGKQVLVEDIGMFVIDDLMAERKTNQIDIFMRDGDDATDFGRRRALVYLLDNPPKTGQLQAMRQ